MSNKFEEKVGNLRKMIRSVDAKILKLQKIRSLYEAQIRELETARNTYRPQLSKEEQSARDKANFLQKLNSVSTERSSLNGSTSFFSTK